MCTSPPPPPPPFLCQAVTTVSSLPGSYRFVMLRSADQHHHPKTQGAIPPSLNKIEKRKMLRSWHHNWGRDFQDTSPGPTCYILSHRINSRIANEWNTHCLLNKGLIVSASLGCTTTSTRHLQDLTCQISRYQILLSV